MNLLLCWLIGPALFLLVAIGLSFGVELISGARVSWLLRPAVGLATMIVLAQLGVSTDTTAELTLPLIAGLGIFGLVMGWSQGLIRGPIPWWEIAAALGVYCVFAAPVVLSGEPTWAGYIKLDDTGTWMGLTDHAFQFGPRTDFPPSTWEAMVQINAGNGYPIGSFVPMALIGRLVGQDVAWTVQPSMALMAAILTLLLSELIRPLVPKAAARAGIAFLGAQSSMLLGYTLWGGVKEASAAAILALGPLTAWKAIERSEARWPWLLPGISATAFLAILGFGGAVWVVPTMLPLLLIARGRLGKRHALILGGAAVAFVAVATIPQLIGPNGLFNPFQGYLFAESELGNLRAPLSILHAIGVWPAHDFRDSPHYEVVTKIMIFVLAGMAVLAGYRAIKDRALPLAGYVIGGTAGFAVIYALGSPWIQGKAMTIISPALLTAAFAGVAVLIQRTRFNIEGWLIGSVAAGLILTSSVLAFEGVYLAPWAEHRELEHIGDRFDGDGPALITEGSTYGGRHFLRKLDAEFAKDLRRRPVYLRNGSKPDDVPYLDTDRIATNSLSPYNLIVLRRSPVASRPPGDFRLAYAGTYYEVWQRAGSPVTGQALVDRLPLGEPPSSSAVPSCGDVAALAAKAGPGATLVAARPNDTMLVDLRQATMPSSWENTGTLFTPGSTGTLEVPVQISTTGSYRLWVGGDIRGSVKISVGGESAPSVREALNETLYQPFGPFALGRGDSTIRVDYDDGVGLHPGSGLESAPLGPLILERIEPTDRGTMLVPASDYRSLCNEPWDWIEAYG
jgi:hypothetical protein